MARHQLILLLLGAAIMLSACVSGERYFGPRLAIPKMSNAWARAFVDLPAPAKWIKDKTPPIAVGLEMNEKFIANMNKFPVVSTYFPDLNFTMEAYTTWITIPKQEAQPFKRILFVWEKTGHIPLNVYGVPHFDVHFTFNDAKAWTTMFDFTNKTMGDCAGINPAGFYKMFKPIPKQCFPFKTHTQVGDVKYGHASHLIPLKNPEWNPPQIFNQTLIYGQWDGEIQFIEPMMSYKYLTSSEVKAAPQSFKTIAPRAYNTARFYPGKYTYYWNKAHTSAFVELGSFRMSDLCVPDKKQGWAGWYPATEALPGPKGLCIAPTPTTWKA